MQGEEGPDGGQEAHQVRGLERQRRESKEIEKKKRNLSGRYNRRCLFESCASCQWVSDCPQCVRYFFSSLDRGLEQAPVHHGQAHDLPGQPLREGLHQEEEQVVRREFLFFLLLPKGKEKRLRV